MGYRIAKGVSERCIARLLLTPQPTSKQPQKTITVVLEKYNSGKTI